MTTETERLADEIAGKIMDCLRSYPSLGFEAERLAKREPMVRIIADAVRAAYGDGEFRQKQAKPRARRGYLTFRNYPDR